MPYLRAGNNEELKACIEQMAGVQGPVMCEIITDTEQVWEPKSSARRREDGTIVSPPLEDLAPFLPREELKANMLIPLEEES